MQNKSIGAALRAMRSIDVYICGHCGKRFAASDKRAKFCCGSCKSAAARARVKEALVVQKVVNP